ncbi:hypothetical protein N7524_009613 [Penicillium chrysogenum]|nr:hypothetical protein N7524_009613 [Penicillium chrysogenum]
MNNSRNNPDVTVVPSAVTTIFSGLPTLVFQLWSSNSGLPTLVFQLWSSNSGLPTLVFHLEHHPR